MPNVNPPRPIPAPAPLTDDRLAQIVAYAETYADGRCGPVPAMIVGLAELRSMTRELTERRATDEPARTEAAAR